MTRRGGLVYAAALLAALLAFSVACSGGGNNGTLLAIDAKTGRELWRAEAPGGAVSAPTIADGQLFVVASDDCTSQASTLEAFDAVTGEQRWQAPTRSGCFSSVQSHGGIVLARADKSVRALDALTGQERWSVTLPGPLAAEPIDTPDVVIVFVEDQPNLVRLHALNWATGSERWVVDAPGPQFSVGQDAANAKNAFFITPPVFLDGSSAPDAAFGLVAINLATGQRQWAINLGHPGSSNAELAVNEDTLIVRFGQSSFHSNTVVSLDASSGKEKWRHEEQGTRIDPFSILVAMGGQTVYVPGLGPSSGAGGCPTGTAGVPAPSCALSGGAGPLANIIDALDVKSGARRWRVDSDPLPESLVASSDVAVLTVSGQTQQLIAFDPATGSRFWERDISQSSQAAPTSGIAGGLVYIAAWGSVPQFGD